MPITHQCFSCCFYLLQSSAYTETGIFLLLMLLCQWGSWGCTGNWEGTEPGHLIQIVQRDIPHHVGSCWTIKLERLAGGLSLLNLRDRLDIGWCVISNCIVHHLLCIFFIIIIFPSFSIVLAHKFLPFSDSLLYLLTPTAGEWVNGCVVLSGLSG